MRAKLEDVCVRGSSNLKQSDVIDKTGEYPIYGAAGYIGNVDFYHQDQPYVAVVKDGAGIGRTSLYPAESSVIGTMQYLLPKENVLPEYLCYVVKYMHLEKYFTGATIPHIYFKDYKKEEFNLDTLDRQKEIVNILGRIECVISSRQQELQKLDELIKARFVEMFGSIHDGKFEMKTLPEIVRNDKNSIKRRPFGGALKKDDFVDEGYLVYEQRHAIHNDFDYAKYYITQEKYEDMIGFKVVPGDLIISCSGVTLGRIAEVPNGAKAGIINQALLKLSLNQELMMNTFFIQQFRGEEIQEILFGFSRGSGIPNMPSMSEVKAVKFVCPPLEMQKQYCDFVHQVDKSKVAVQKALEKTQLLFDSLMQQYFG
ncbi:MAG: restriction endonuclease subunit S [Blautia sp.]